MEYLLELNLNDGTDFNLGYGSHYVDGKYYSNLINSLTGFTRVLTTGKNLETPSMTARFKDSDKIIRSHFADEVKRRKNTGSYGTLKDISGNTLQKLKVTGFSVDGDYTSLDFTQNIDIIKNNLFDVIKEQEYPDAVSDAYGKIIRYLHGQVNGGGTSGSYSAWKVNLNGVGHYLLSAVHLDSVDRVMHAGVNQASGWTLVNHTDRKAYLIFSNGTADTVEVNVTRTISTVSGFFTDIFDDLFGSYGYTPTTAFLNRMERALDSATNFYSPCFDKQLKGEQFMDLFMQAFSVDWYIGNDGEIKLSWLDIESQVGNESEIFLESDVSSFSLRDPEDPKNEILFKFKYLNTGGSYKHQFTFHKTDSSDDSQVYNGTVENRFTDYDRPAFAGAKHFANLRQYPIVRATVTFQHKYNVEKFLDMPLGDIIKLTHKKALSTDARYYRVERMNFALDGNSVTCTLQDVCWLTNIADIVFCLQSGFSGVNSASQYWYDFSPNCTHGNWRGGNAKHSTAQPFFKSASGRLNSGDFQALSALKKTTINFFKLQGDDKDFILCSWFRPDADIEDARILGLYEDSDNHIGVNLKSSNIVGNGSFETAGSGGADVFAGWSEYTSGSSTITRDTSTKYHGSASCRIDIDASNNQAYVYESITMTAGSSRSLSLYYQMEGPLTTAYLQIYDSGSNVWLKSDGTWAASSQTITLSTQSSWSEIALNFTAHASYSNYIIKLQPGAWAHDGNSVWFDKVKITDPNGGILNLEVVNGGVSQLDVDSVPCAAAETKYFLLMAKIGTDWGVYLGEFGGNATQKIYGSYSAGDYINPNIDMGRKGNGTEYMDMYFDEVLCIRSNPWSLDPVSDLTDSLAVPSGSFTDRLVS